MKKRIFLGIPLAEESRQALKKQLMEIKIPGKVVPPKNWHFTLQFLGELEESELKKLDFILSTLNLGPPFSASLRKLAAFPNEKSARILWLGINNELNEGNKGEGEGLNNGLAHFNRLAKTITDALIHEKYQIDTRPYIPHITLSRFYPPRNMLQWIQDIKLEEVLLTIHSVLLYESILGEGPTQYLPLKSYPLL